MNLFWRGGEGRGGGGGRGKGGETQRWGVSNFSGKSVTKVYGSTLLALRGGGWGSKFLEKSVT